MLLPLGLWFLKKTHQWFPVWALGGLPSKTAGEHQRENTADSTKEDKQN